MKIFFLYPFSILYGAIVYFRNRFFDYGIILKSKEYSIPIISVGNISVGGTGKTPHVEYLVSLLKNQWKIATLSRGYKRKSKGFVLANSNSTVREIGDEPKQIKQKFPKIDVAVDGNRRRGIDTLLRDGNSELNTIILDDAFQHRYVKPGLSILLIDFNRPMFNDKYLPVGNLRESRHEKRRANIIIITKCPDEITPIEKRILIKRMELFPYQNLFFTKQLYASPKRVFDNDELKENIEISNYTNILLVSGIARPELLKKYLEKKVKNLQSMIFSDHHNFTLNDLKKIERNFAKLNSDNKIIITTEKDAVRLRDSGFNEILKALPIYYLPITIEFIDKDADEFNKYILDYVSKNKRNSNLHTEQNKY